MPKATLTFDLPEEHEEFMSAVQGNAWNVAIFEFDQWLRSQIKYGDRDELQEVRDRLNQEVMERGLEL